jgi:hypothetical protein
MTEITNEPMYEILKAIRSDVTAMKADLAVSVPPGTISVKTPMRQPVNYAAIEGTGSVWD